MINKPRQEPSLLLYPKWQTCFLNIYIQGEKLLLSSNKDCSCQPFAEATVEVAFAGPDNRNSEDTPKIRRYHQRIRENSQVI